MSFDMSQYNRLGSLIIVSGASGTGKSSILKPVIKEDPNLDFSVSCTTRQPRPGEKNAVDYYFIDVDKFKKLIGEKAFIEYANVHGNYYGTLKSEVEGELQKGKDVILDIDIQGALIIKKNFSKDTLIGKLSEFVFIMPPSYEELEKRLKGRGTETEESINKRLTNAKEEMKHFLEYDYCIVNDNLNKAIADFKAVIDSLRCKTRNLILKSQLR